MSQQRHRPRWPVLIFAAVWTIVVLIFFVYPWYKDRIVAQRQQTTSGTIVAHEPANHNRYGYAFNVGQKSYRGWQVPHDNDEFTVGQIVTVHYDPVDPNNSALEDFSELGDRDLGPVLFLIPAIPLVALIEFLRRRGKARIRDEG